MVKNNRINEEDLREGLKEKARLAKEEMADMKSREAEKEEREVHEPRDQESND